MPNAKTRRAYVVLEYDGGKIEISGTSGPTSVTYTDNIDKADDLQIAFADPNALWRSAWLPKVSEKETGA